MPVLVSCARCKRAVLIAPSIGDHELDALGHHVGTCRSGDESVDIDRAGAASILRHFRVTAIEQERRASRRTRTGGRHVR